MRRNILLGLLLMLAPVLTLGQETASGPASEAKPVADTVEKVKDFGIISKGDKLKATFEIRNTGTAPLEITAVRPTCGCTVANFDRNIAPGGTGKIQAEVDTSAFTGPITKAIIAFTNDKDNPQINLVVKAEVRSFIEVLPRQLLRLNVLQGEPATDKVVLVSAEGSDFKVTGIDTAGGPYQASFRELADKERIPERKGPQWEVSVTVPGDAPEGMLNHKLIIKTTAEKAAEIPLNVSGVVRPIVQVIPPEIDFGSVPGDAPIGRNLILINNRQGAQLELTKVETDDPAFTAEVVPLQAGQRYQVAVSMAAGTAKGTHKATLKISTNDPARKQIDLPIKAVVQ
ncbi:MAG: DUF1573 domain-containing protein [Acidobacteriota bacterium]